MYPIEDSIKYPFNMAIMLLCIWGCIFKVQPQPFLLAGFLDGDIFSSMIAVNILYLEIIFLFQIFNWAYHNVC